VRGLQQQQMHMATIHFDEILIFPNENKTGITPNLFPLSDGHITVLAMKMFISGNTSVNLCNKK
jgi:hypothetical protein